MIRLGPPVREDRELPLAVLRPTVEPLPARADAAADTPRAAPRPRSRGGLFAGLLCGLAAGAAAFAVLVLREAGGDGEMAVPPTEGTTAVEAPSPDISAPSPDAVPPGGTTVAEVEEAVPPANGVEEAEPGGEEAPPPSATIAARPPERDVEPSPPAAEAGAAAGRSGIADEDVGVMDPALTAGATLFVHAPIGVEAEELSGVTTSLAEAGVQIREPIRVGFSISATHVRYYHEEDAELARAVARRLSATARDFTTYRPLPQPGTLEVWLEG